MATKRSLLIGIVVILLSAFILPDNSYAQRKGPPPWAPAHGYRAKMRQVYFPQYNFYYDTRREVYIYMGRRGWEIGVSLPARYAQVDLNACARVPLDIDTDTPQMYNRDHRMRYAAWSQGGDDRGKPSHGKGKKKKW